MGWTLESPGRGTLTLLSTCLVTTALCTWVVIHPRIYKRKKFRFWHKVALWLKTIIAPELIAVEAAQEWTQARSVVQRLAEYCNGELGMAQAFYIGMFGIRYRTPNGTRVLWPNQFIWLLQKGLLDWTDHARWGLILESVKDKSNADPTAKIFAIIQVAWFVAQSIMRAAHDLPLAPLESMTLGYIPLFALTYAYWWIKPKDVNTPSEIELPQMTDMQRATFESMTIDDKFDEEGAPNQESLWNVWALTIRMFEKEAMDRELREEEGLYEEKRHIFEVHRKGCILSDCDAPNHVEPVPPQHQKVTILAHWDPEFYHSRILWPLACLAGISFPALHLISWDTRFPTVEEMWLWRATAIASIASMLVFMQFERIVVVRWLDPLIIFKLGLPAIYLLSRMIMLLLAFAAFRASDPAIYQTYVVSSYWIHLI